MRGRTINIFIPDGNPRGVKVCEIQDSIVKAIYIPRNKIDEVLKRSDLREPGIYFLFGGDDSLAKPLVYVGEAEDLIVRIKQHNSGKDFWNAVICFTSEKKNINKAHIKYLESYCCEQIKKINKAEIENTITPTQSSLTEREVDFVLSFFDDLKILLSTLGYPIFEENKKEKSNLFICKGKDAFAEGEYAEDGFIVFAGAQANIEEARAIGVWASNIRKVLIEEGVMKNNGQVYVFLEDYTFKSPSAAAAVVLGRSANGWTEWKDSIGKTLDERYRKDK